MLSRPPALLAIFLVSGAASAQPSTPTPPTTFLSLRFNNGSIVQQAVLLDPVEMDTKLGKITVPAAEIQRIDLGFRLNEDDAKKVETALRDLGSDKYPTREAASKTLLSMGKLAYPGLLGQRKNGDLELTRRIDQLLKDIQARVPAEGLHTRRTDIVRTSDSTVSGQITSPHLRVKCEIFGEVKIPLWRLRDVRSLSANSDVLIAVDAGKYGNRTSWMETEYEVTLGSKIEFSVSGAINLDPLNMVGNPNTRNVMPQGALGLVSGEGYVPGQMLGRIGTDGQIFVIGPRHTLLPSREGKLFLRIVTIEHASNVRAEGSYKVQVTSEPSAP